MTGAAPRETSSADELDLAIIHCLQIDGRLPFRTIGSALEVSEQTVARRYRRLRADGLVRVVAVVDPAWYGQSSWLVRIQPRPESAAALARALADRDDVSWVSIGAGGSTVSASVQTRSAVDRDDLLLTRLPRNTQVLGMSVHAVLHTFSPASGPDWSVRSARLDAAGERRLLALRPTRRAAKRVLPAPGDDTMLAALAGDGRAGVAELAAVSGWSPARTARRLDDLIATGVLMIDCDVARQVLGWPVTAEIWLTIEPAQLAAAGQAVADLDDVAFAGAVTGTANLFAVGAFRDDEELYRFLTERIGPIPGVRQAEVSPILRRLKQAGSLVDRDDRLRGPRPR